MLNDEVKNIWNANADFWDGRMGEGGNSFHRTLIEPTQLRLLGIEPGHRVLDIACGNGQFARRLAGLGANVTAIDFAERFIEIARSRGSQHIDYRVVDVTRTDELAQLAGHDFDAVVCTMAMMDMADLSALASHLPSILKAGGIFVFSVLHPCFNSGEVVLVHELDDLGGEVKSRYGVKVSSYLVERTGLGVGMVGQPKPQYYFHRPVSTILRPFFAAGFVLDAFEEPSFADGDAASSIFDNVFKSIPPALVCRLRMQRRAGRKSSPIT
jgi:SAM-dependent methyltransferase